MGRDMRWFVVVLGLVFVAKAEAADRCTVWTIGNATFRYCPESRELAVTQGKTTFHPLAGLGPEFLWQGKPRPLTEVSIGLVRAEADQAGLRCRYRARHGSLENQYTLRLAPTEEGLQIRIQSEAAACCRVRPGKTEGFGQWFRFSYTRHAEPYGQSGWPRVAFVPKRLLYVSGSWDMAASHGTSWEATDERFSGTGDFASAVDVVYQPRTDGTRLPIDETLTLRVGSDLSVEPVPLPSQKPSEYRQELAHEVFLDVWGGTAKETEYFLRHLAADHPGEDAVLHRFPELAGGRVQCFASRQHSSAGLPAEPGYRQHRRVPAIIQVCPKPGPLCPAYQLHGASRRRPERQAGKAHAALDAQGKRKWHTRPGDWLTLAGRQERDNPATVHAPNAGFTDQLSSGGAVVVLP